MHNSWLKLILFGLSANFMPVVFGIEILILGDKEGVKKSSGLIGGVNSFRLLIAAALVFVTASITATLGRGASDLGPLLRALASRLGRGVVSGEHSTLDMLLVVAGVLLMVQALKYTRARWEKDAAAGAVKPRTLPVSAAGAIGLGLAVAASNVNQWIFTVASVNQILQMNIGVLGRLLAFLLFLIVANLVIVLPVIVAILHPSNGSLQALNVRAHGALRYVIAALMITVSVLLVWWGVGGLVNSLTL